MSERCEFMLENVFSSLQANATERLDGKRQIVLVVALVPSIRTQMNGSTHSKKISRSAFRSTRAGLVPAPFGANSKHRLASFYPWDRTGSRQSQPRDNCATGRGNEIKIGKTAATRSQFRAMML